jgi:hypothetical protein
MERMRFWLATGSPREVLTEQQLRRLLRAHAIPGLDLHLRHPHRDPRHSPQSSRLNPELARRPKRGDNRRATQQMSVINDMVIRPRSKADFRNGSRRGGVDVYDGSRVPASRRASTEQLDALLPWIDAQRSAAHDRDRAVVSGSNFHLSLARLSGTAAPSAFWSAYSTRCVDFTTCSRDWTAG